MRQKGSAIMLVDAGGGTIDLSTYCLSSVSPIVLDEIAPIGCILQGSTRVNVRAERFLRSKLSGSRYGFYDEVKNMLNSFETYTKPTFKDPKDNAYIKFGSMRDRDPEYGIRNGQLVLEGTEVAELFEPSIKGVLAAIHEQQDHASKPVSARTPYVLSDAFADRVLQEIFLVGGFAASPWLFHRLKGALQTREINISRPDNHTNKAVAEGVVSFALEHFVATRIATMSYGVRVNEYYKANDPEHRARQLLSFVDVTGATMLKNRFSVLVSKGTQFSQTAEIRKPMMCPAQNPNDLNTTRVDLLAYRGINPTPRWTDIESDRFTTLCRVSGDTSRVRKSPITGPRGVYYVQNYEIVLSVGLTEMEAHVAWIENGIRMRGPAEIVFYD